MVISVSSNKYYIPDRVKVRLQPSTLLIIKVKKDPGRQLYPQGEQSPSNECSMYILKGMDTLSQVFRRFYKGDDFSEFLLTFLYLKPRLKTDPF